MPTPALEDKLMASSGLLNEPHFRRLLKFQTRRRKSLVSSELEIRTSVSQELLNDSNSGAALYCMHIYQPEDARDRAEHSTQWVLKKRYSELDSFRSQLLKRIELWEHTVFKTFSSKTAADTRKTFALVSNAMRRAISPTFPRKRMRGDSPAAVKERVEGLPTFVRKLLGVHMDLSVYITNPQLKADSFATAWDQLHTIWSELEAFLEIPQPQKDAEARRQLAVLALQDVDVPPNPADESSSEQLCSICLNEDPATQDVKALVSLPCNHHFHEDCVIDWFGTSMTCPLCRSSFS